jgi:NTP pyrophosphatase (non-canonical NTP hydrolase)
MTINQWCKYVNNWAKRKGWWTPPSDSAKIHLNIISEVVEASEEVRNNHEPFYWGEPQTIEERELGLRKPEGEAVELADAVIRIMDYFGHKGWDLERIIKLKMKYNETRPRRHGNKKY